MRIKYFADAELDLMEINRYFREVDGSALANKMITWIRAEIRVIKDNPHIAPPYELASGVRRLVVVRGAFLVFYRVGATTIEVMHIRRAERMPISEYELNQLTTSNKEPNKVNA